MQNGNLKFKGEAVFGFIGIIFFFLFSYSASAAELKLVKFTETVGTGDTFAVSLLLNTENEYINAIESNLKYSENLRLERVSDGNSVVNLWISKPKPDMAGNTVFLSGLIPGGIKTQEGIVVNFNFKSLAEGPAGIQIADAKTLLNNPEASETKTKTISLNFKIGGAAATVPVVQKLILDFAPPDKFKIYLSNDKNMFGGSRFISFNATDKGSGVDYYEIKETFLGIFGQWIKANSPYPLYYQNLFSIIKVRAVDNVGRERVAALVPVRLYIFYGFLIGTAVLVIFFKIFKYLKQIKKRT